MRVFLLLLLPLFANADPSSDKIDSLIKFMQSTENKSEYALMIDMSVPSNEKRLFVVQLDTKKVIYSACVAHGKGSGTGTMATTFSNESGSLCSSLGKYKVGENYKGEHGDSYRLTGLETTNENAMDRAIVIHAAWYVKNGFIKKNKRCGNSWGCPAVSPKTLKKIKPFLKEGVILWIYN